MEVIKEALFKEACFDPLYSPHARNSKFSEHKTLLFAFKPNS